MDISETYIKMCDDPEIQEQWKPKEGDWMFSLNEIYSIGHYRFISEDTLSCCAYDYDFFPFNQKDYIWLPRQDQIQEMYGWIETSIKSITLAIRFAEFCGINNEDAEGISNVSIRKGSMEQLWLAFYMWEEHKKVWDGKKWVKKEQ